MTQGEKVIRNPDISTRWFPDCSFGARSAVLDDQVFRDFDQQAERLIGHDQSYLQLTPGAFQGRFLSGFLGDDVAIHMEYSSQALDQQVSGAAGQLSIGLLLGKSGEFRINGMSMSAGHLFLLPPGGFLHVLSPPGGEIMALTIRSETLKSEPGLALHIAEWFDRLEDQVEMLHAPRLADRLRSDAVSAMESATQAASPQALSLIARALVASVAAQFTLQLPSPLQPHRAPDISWERFRACRASLLSGLIRDDNAGSLATLTNSSKRSVEAAFARHSLVGPLTWFRIMRLHRVRRQLICPQSAHLSIGDIAAEHGFWDWSRFSGQYQRHFGELPSATRRVLLQ